MAEPILDLMYLDSHSLENLVIADISTYTNFNVSTPTIEITPPGYPTISLAFTNGGIQVYNSESLGVSDSGCGLVPLPDGIYKIKYSVYPAYKYYVNKDFLRIDQLLQKFDKAYLKLDILQCDLTFKREQRKTLDLIWAYISGAIASANNCAEKQAMELYNRANESIIKFLEDVEEDCM